MKTLTLELATNQQVEQLARFASDAARKAVKEYFEKNKTSKAGAQKVHGDAGFTARIREIVITSLSDLSVTDKYANEEVTSTYTYPPEFKGPKPIVEQINTLATSLGLNPASALAYAQNLPALESFVPKDALPWTNWFAILSDQSDRRRILNKISRLRAVYNYRESQMDRFRVHEHTVRGLEQVLTMQGDGDILLVAAQLGMRHRGRSTRRARELFARNEYGATSMMGGCIALTHPERFVRWEQLHMDLPGDEFDDPVSDVRFDRAPRLVFNVRLGFGASDVSGAGSLFGSASWFLPPSDSLPSNS